MRLSMHTLMHITKKKTPVKPFTVIVLIQGSFENWGKKNNIIKTCTCIIKSE